jgi:cysteine desulfurase
MTDRIYLDHASTTPIIPAAREAFARGVADWANPNSPHAEGRRSRSLLEEARQTIADVLGWRHDVIFTSGASESVELAARCATPAVRAHGATEHAIVGHAMGDCSTVIHVDANGLIDEAAFDDVLSKGPALIAIQHVNNETGVIQPLDRLAPKIREAGSLLLSDCAQSASKMPLPDADFIAIYRHLCAQARRAAGRGSASRPRSRLVEGLRGRSGEGLSPRNTGRAGRSRLRRSTCRQAL